jgi:hypothetical protein
MGMPEHDDLGLGEGLVKLCRRRRNEPITVGDRDVEVLEFDFRHRGTFRTDVDPVHVSVHRRDWSDGFEFEQDIDRPDVTAVDDVIDLLEDVENRIREVTVGVGNDAVGR